MASHGDMPVKRGQASGGGLDLRPANVGLGIDYLALQIGWIHRVRVGENNSPHPRRGEIEGRGRAQPPAPTIKTRAAFNFCWPGPPISRSTRWRA